MQNLWGVNKMFYGRCENGEYVNNFIYLSFSEILHIKKCATNISQAFFR